MKNHFFFDGSKDRKNPIPLAFCVYINKKQIKKRIGEKIDQSDFNQETQRVKKNHPESKRINAKLNKIEEEYDKLLKEKNKDDITNEDITLLLTAVKSNKTIEEIESKRNLLSYWIQKYLDEKTNSKDAQGAYKYTKMSIDQFESTTKIPITFDYLSKNVEVFRNQLVDFLKSTININGKIKKGNKPGTVINKINCINAVINWYNDLNRINIPRLKTNVNKDNKIEDTEIAHLDENELVILYDLWVKDLIKANEEHLKLMGRFLFRCFTGLRIVEQTNNLSINNFQTDSLIYHSSKTKKKQTIPLFNQAKIIAKKLKYEWYDFNGYLDKKAKTTKESSVVRKLVKEYINDRELIEYSYDKGKSTTFSLTDKISSHSARKTFGTIIYKHTNNVFAASKFLNHSDIKDTIRYLRINIEDLRDYVTDLKIGGMPVLGKEKKEELNKKQSGIILTKMMKKEIHYPIIYSNIIISFEEFSFNTDNLRPDSEYNLDTKYSLKGKIFILQNSKIFISHTATLYDRISNREIKQLTKGLYKVSKKGFEL